jgi:Ni/Co efflux regulator RcnB
VNQSTFEALPYCSHRTRSGSSARASRRKDNSMNKILIGAAALSLVLPSLAAADPNDHGRDGQRGDQHSEQHAGWGHEYGGGHNFRRGERMGYNDWSSAQPLDYRQHHLRRPPHGYEWRESNGQFVLAAVATGLIASAIINSGR